MVEALLYTISGVLVGVCVKLAWSVRRTYQLTKLTQEKAEWAYSQSVRALDQLHSDDTDKILAGLQTIVMLNDFEIRVTAFARLAELARSDNALIRHHAEIALNRLSSTPDNITRPRLDQ